MSQTRTGNREGVESAGSLLVGRCAPVSGAAPSGIGVVVSSTAIAGQASSVVMSRATRAPPAPITTNADSTAPAARMSDAGGTTLAQADRNAPEMSGSRRSEAHHGDAN